MVNAFISFIEKDDLFKKEDKILLAVSGGMDSIVMCALFHQAKFAFGIAHCNFMLRGEESTGDEDFVRKTAEKYHVPFFTKKFDTRYFAEQNGISIQMAARDLRYEWFSELLQSFHFDYVATAHHLDDEIETFFINLSRQSGIAGFHGILSKKGKLIRPLLFASKKEIRDYVKKNAIAFREDSSNQETKYLRNKIRHEILPLFGEINPDINTIISGNIHRIREAEMIFREAIEQQRKKILQTDKNCIILPIEKLKALHPISTFTFELLSPFGFNLALVNEIIASLDHTPGKTWFSATHRLIKDRKNLIISNLKDQKSPAHEPIMICAETRVITAPVHLFFNKIPKDRSFKIDGAASVANLDVHKLTFPLIIRKWEKGDHFYPFGTGHKKKLSDFFTDLKLSLADKESIWLLCSGEKIVWVIGYRIDHRFRITPATKEVYMIKCKN